MSPYNQEFFRQSEILRGKTAGLQSLYCMSESGCKIEYPCRWKYKIIGSDQGRMESAIAETVRGREYTINLSRSSKGGNYHSFNLQVTVENDKSRVEIYETLRKHPAIKFVL